jgi:hypothetical protein
MNRRVLIYCISLLITLVIGYFAGGYFTGMYYRYRMLYYEVAGSLFRLEMLNNDRVDPIRKIAELDIITGSARIDRLPAWAREYTPDDLSSPLPETEIQKRLKILQALKDSKSNRSYISYYGLSDADFERILRKHFAYSGGPLKVDRRLEEHWKKWKDDEKTSTEPAPPVEPSQSSGR